jgi:hypothetical protein
MVSVAVFLNLDTVAISRHDRAAPFFRPALAWARRSQISSHPLEAVSKPVLRIIFHRYLKFSNFYQNVSGLLVADGGLVTPFVWHDFILAADF